MKDVRGNYKRYLSLPWLIPYADRFSKAGSISISSGVEDVFMTEKEMIAFDEQFNRHAIEAYKRTVKAIEEDGQVLSRIQPTDGKRLDISVELPEPTEEYEMMRTMILDEKIKSQLRPPLDRDPFKELDPEEVTPGRLEELAKEYPFSLRDIEGIYSQLSGCQISNGKYEYDPGSFATMTKLKEELQKIVSGEAPSNMRFSNDHSVEVVQECNQGDVILEAESTPEIKKEKVEPSPDVNTNRLNEQKKNPGIDFNDIKDATEKMNEEEEKEQEVTLRPVDHGKLKDIPLLFFPDQIDPWCPVCFGESEKRAVMDDRDVGASIIQKLPFVMCLEHRQFVSSLQKYSDRSKVVNQMETMFKELKGGAGVSVEFRSLPNRRNEK